MAGRGPAPKQHHQRERDTRRRQADNVYLEDDGVLRGPELVGSYSPETLAWYDDWRRSPMARLFIVTDWRRLALLAPMVEKHLSSPSAAALSEIRLNEERLGATYVDRLRAKLTVETDESPSAPVTPLRAVKRERTDV